VIATESAIPKLGPPTLSRFPHGTSRIDHACPFVPQMGQLPPGSGPPTSPPHPSIRHRCLASRRLSAHRSDVLTMQFESCALNSHSLYQNQSFVFGIPREFPKYHNADGVHLIGPFPVLRTERCHIIADLRNPSLDFEMSRRSMLKRSKVPNPILCDPSAPDCMCRCPSDQFLSGAIGEPHCSHANTLPIW
jgi:hypothetical protein